MLTKKRVFLCMSGVLLLVVVTGCVVYFAKKWHKHAYTNTAQKNDQKPTIVEAPTLDQLKSQGVKFSPEADAGLNEVNAQKAIDSKNYSVALTNSKKIYEDTSLQVSTRVNAYSICITAAKNLNDTNTQNTCKEAAYTLIEASKSISTNEHDYLIFIIKLALGEVKESDFEGLNSGRQ